MIGLGRRPLFVKPNVSKKLDAPIFPKKLYMGQPFWLVESQVHSSRVALT